MKKIIDLSKLFPCKNWVENKIKASDCSIGHYSASISTFRTFIGKLKLMDIMANKFGVYDLVATLLDKIQKLNMKELSEAVLEPHKINLYDSIADVSNDIKNRLNGDENDEADNDELRF